MDDHSLQLLSLPAQQEPSDEIRLCHRLCKLKPGCTLTFGDFANIGRAGHGPWIIGSSRAARAGPASTSTYRAGWFLAGTQGSHDFRSS